MIKDPLTRWDGLFPYDALAPVGITPESSMKEVMDASFELMAQGLMTPEVRKAWDELRNKQRRLLVDFFLYQFDFHEELNRATEALDRQLAELAAIPDVSRLLEAGLDDLSQIRHDCREIAMQNVEIQFMTEFEGAPELPNLEFIQFDQG